MFNGRSVSLVYSLVLMRVVVVVMMVMVVVMMVVMMVVRTTNYDLIDFDSSPYQNSSQGLGAPPLTFKDKKMKKIR